jgi:Putative zinc-finger
MPGETKSGMQCAEFDALLSDALDGVLTGTDMERFEAHKASCPSCGPLFAEAGMGYKMLHSLAEVEPPRNMVHNILVATIGEIPVVAQEVQPVGEGWMARLRRWTQPVFGPVLQPRFAMSFGMAFFSISLMLHVSGVKAADFKHLDLRPGAIIKTFYETEGRLVKYYENIRVVYEIESRVQQLKNATRSDEAPATPEKQEQKEQKKSEPGDKTDRNLSRENDAATFAQQLGCPTLTGVGGVGCELVLRRLS